MRSKFVSLTIASVCMLFFTSCAQKSGEGKTKQSKTSMVTMDPNAKIDTLTIGGGCFWCMEAVFQRLNGVVKVESGYGGGHIKNPAYREVCAGTTGHAEAVQITYDANIISLADLLHVFFKVHDPTTLNRQGGDAGTQYRSVIFYRSDEQKKEASEIIAGLDKSGAFDSPIVTEVTPFTNFYKAEDYHQDYYNLNKNSNPYCRIVIVPKLDKLETYFKDKMKKE